MLEALAFDFPAITDGKQHFLTHEERNEFLVEITPAPIYGVIVKTIDANPLAEMAPAFKSLYTLSKRARYLAENRNSPVMDVGTSDLKVTAESFEKVQKVIERVYKQNNKTPVWTVGELLDPPK